MDVIMLWQKAESQAEKGSADEALKAYNTFIESIGCRTNAATELVAMAQLRMEKILAARGDEKGAAEARKNAIELCAGLCRKKSLMNVQMYTAACLRHLEGLVDQKRRAEARLMYNRISVIAKNDCITLSKAACLMLELSHDRGNDMILYAYAATQNADRAVELNIPAARAVRMMVYMSSVETLLNQGEMQTARQLFSRMDEFKAAEKLGLESWFEQMQAALAERKWKEGC